MHMAHSNSFYFSHFLKTSTAALAVVLCLDTSWAADPSAAALRVLLGTGETAQVGASTAESNAAQRTQRRSITVMRGETLDRAVRRAVPGLPLDLDFLRQAFVTVNPQVFPKGAAHAMRAGTVLQVPTADELRFLLMSKYPEAVHLFQMVETKPSVEQDPPQTKRHWVRFP